MTNKRSSLTLATAFGGLALLPFAVGVYYAYTGDSLDARTALRWLLPYLATIVAFIGGVQWGRMLAQKSVAARDMALAVMPALIAWGALVTAPPPGAACCCCSRSSWPGWSTNTAPAAAGNGETFCNCGAR